MSLLVLIDGLDQGTMLHYKPGQGDRFPVTALLSGVLTDLGAPPVLTIHGADGSTITPTVVHDSQGTYHADYAHPSNATPGVWVRRWTASGGSPSADAAIESRYIVDAPDF